MRYREDDPTHRLSTETKHFLRDQLSLVRARGIERPPVEGVTAEDQLEVLVANSKLGEKWRVMSRYNTFAQVIELALTDRLGNALVFHKSAAQLSAVAAESAQAGYAAARARFDAQVVGLLSAPNDRLFASLATERAQHTTMLSLAAELVVGWGTELFKDCTSSFQEAVKESQGAAVTSMLAAAVSRPTPLHIGGGGSGQGGGLSTTSGAARKRKSAAGIAEAAKQRARDAEATAAAAATHAPPPSAGADRQGGQPQAGAPGNRQGPPKGKAQGKPGQ